MARILRSHNDNFRDIIMTIGEGKNRQTNIMYLTNLNYVTVKERLLAVGNITFPFPIL